MKKLAEPTIAPRDLTEVAREVRRRAPEHDGRITVYDELGNAHRRFSVDVRELIQFHGWSLVKPRGKVGKRQ